MIHWIEIDCIQIKIRSERFDTQVLGAIQLIDSTVERAFGKVTIMTLQTMSNLIYHVDRLTLIYWSVCRLSGAQSAGWNFE
jgi:hypothetical protein